MRELTLDESKKIQLEILDVVTGFCEERGINYWLDFGTLIGAIRHKGYIPWDDDVDISMLRPDYDRFMKEFNGYNPRYEFRCIENDPDFVRPFGRVFDTKTLALWDNMDYLQYGLNIDVFVLDNAPDDDAIAEKMFRLRDFWHCHNLATLRKESIFRPAKGNVIRRLCVYAFRGLLRVLPRGFCSRRVIANSKRYAAKNTKRVGNFTGYYDILCDREAFTSFIDVEFEGKKYKATAGYDRWLRAAYGDYMQFPPVEERVRLHLFTGYFKDE